MTTTNKPEINIGSFVNDRSGIAGEVTGLGQIPGTVRVKFGKDCYRDLYPEKLTLAKYSPAQLDKIRHSAPELLEALQSVYRDLELNNVKGGSDELNAMVQSAIQKATV